MMPMPMQGGSMMGGGPGPGVQVGPPNAAEGPEQANPDTIKKQLVMLLSKAKEMAEKSGVNFSEVVAEVEGAKSKSDVPLPRPPAP